MSNLGKCAFRQDHAKAHDNILKFSLCRPWVDDISNFSDGEHFTLSTNSEFYLFLYQKEEKDNRWPFLDILISYGEMQRKIYRWATWGGHHLQFSSFVPVAHKRRLVSTLFCGVQAICIHVQVQKEGNFTKTDVAGHTLSGKFHRTAPRNRIYVEKKQIFVVLPLRGLFKQINKNI